METVKMSDIEARCQEDVYYDTFTCDSILECNSCVQRRDGGLKSSSGRLSESISDGKNNDEANTKSIIEDNNDRVNRINEEETSAQEEAGQIMQMKRIDGKNDERNEGDEKVKQDLMSEHSLQGSPNLSENSGLLDEDNQESPKPNTSTSIIRIDGEGDTKLAREGDGMMRRMESKVSVITEKMDSVRVYSDQDFSQISDCSDEEVGDIRKSASTQVIIEQVGDNILNADDKAFESEIHRKQFISEANGNDETIEQNSRKSGKGYQSSVRREEQNNSQVFGRNSVTKIRSDDFETTNSRIHGSYQEETKKRGIRILQPPGGFSQGLW
ncbi:hypothetical protein WDU94_004451 [Cyamophila willieti]